MLGICFEFLHTNSELYLGHPLYLRGSASLVIAKLGKNIFVQLKYLQMTQCELDVKYGWTCTTSQINRFELKQG